jgi:hypothetical protein
MSMVTSRGRHIGLISEGNREWRRGLLCCNDSRYEESEIHPFDVFLLFIHFEPLFPANLNLLRRQFGVQRHLLSRLTGRDPFTRVVDCHLLEIGRVPSGFELADTIVILVGV